jgi:hypothetical protein
MHVLLSNGEQNATASFANALKDMNDMFEVPNVETGHFKLYVSKMTGTKACHFTTGITRFSSSRSTKSTIQDTANCRTTCRQDKQCFVGHFKFCNIHGILR